MARFFVLWSGERDEGPVGYFSTREKAVAAWDGDDPAIEECGMDEKDGQVYTRSWTAMANMNYEEELDWVDEHRTWKTPAQPPVNSSRFVDMGGNFDYFAATSSLSSEVAMAEARRLRAEFRETGQTTTTEQGLIRMADFAGTR